MITISSRKMAMHHQISNYVLNGSMLMPKSGSMAQHPRTAQIVKYFDVVSKSAFNPELREYTFSDVEAKILTRLILDQALTDYQKQYSQSIEQVAPTAREQRLSQVGGLSTEATKDIFQDVKIGYDLFNVLLIAYQGSFIWKNDGGTAELEAGQ